jgi:mannose-6-phosphate isomerase
MLPRALKLQPEYRDYVWGGQRLRPGRLTAEAWVVHENNLVADSPLAGKTLAEVTQEYGSSLLGQPVIERRGPRFPLLVKLLDCNNWLSLQVHPNDEQAASMEGAGQNGKTEAWHILEASPAARIIAGLKPGTEYAAMAQAARQGTIETLANYENVSPGDTVFMRAGTIHALGPGLLVYEVQETSDITYRVFDWNRPQANGRVLHINKSLAVADPSASSRPLPCPALENGASHFLCSSEYFNLELLNSQDRTLALDTQDKSFHTLTVIDGEALFSSGSEQVRLEKFETLLVPASAGEYSLAPRLHGFKALRASL